MKSAYWLPLCFSLSACSVAALEDTVAEHTQNRCSADVDCGSGVCDAGECRAREGAFSTVLFEVTAPADANAIAGVRFLKRVERLQPSGGQQDLAVGRVARVTGSLELTKAPDQTCTFDTQASARVTFIPTERFLGLATASYATTTHSATASNGSAQRQFNLNLPPGEYDVYVQEAGQAAAAAPSSASLQRCPFVPKLIRHLQIEPGLVTLPLALEAPARLDVTVVWPSEPDSGGLEGWSIDIVEPVFGKVISTNAVLGQPRDNAYTATVFYSWVEDGMQPGTELVRLSPPADEHAPTILLERSSLELFERGAGMINQLDALPSPVTFEGQVERQGRSDPVPAALSLIATELNQLQPGTLASFRQTVTTDSRGRFQVQLLPGKYRVHAVPAASSGAASTETTLEVAGRPEYQAGKVIELKDTLRMSGGVLGPAGQAISGASVHAAATPFSIRARLLEAALGDEPFVPRAAGCSGPADACVPVTDEMGYFSIDVDPGVFDVSVRPPSDSGFPWLIRSNVDVQTEQQDLGALDMPLPVAYRGTVFTEDTGPISGALIRAYIYVDENGYTAEMPSADTVGSRSVLQIAETRANESGIFELRLPSGFAAE
jgi:hypothetical protein